MSDSVLIAHSRVRSGAAVAGAVLLLAGLVTPVLAQQAGPPRSGEGAGMRYLSWAGKPAGPASADGLRRPDAMAMAPTQPNGLTPAVRYPGIQNGAQSGLRGSPQSVSRPSRYGPGSDSHSLTPASAWMAPASMAPAPMPMARADAPVAMAAPAYQQPAYQQPAYSQPAYQPQPQAQQPMTAAPNPAQVQADAQAQAAYQARMQAQYQAWYQSEAQRQYQAQVEAMPQYREQQVTVQQAPAMQVSAAPMQAQPAQPQPVQGQPLQMRADAGPMPSAASAADPMAPRRDAMIFRMQQQDAAAQDAPQTQQADQPKAAGDAINAPVLSQPTNGRTYGGRAYAGAEPPRETARYYSVHREDGRQPDPIAMPESVYLDGASVDLAEPPPTPVQTRTANGRVQTVVPNSDPSLP